MSHLEYHNYKGWGDMAKETYNYSQAVKVGDRIECSGQGGWDQNTYAVDSDVTKQIEQAFINVDTALKHAGGKGWEEVYRVNSYHVPASDEAMGAMIQNFKKWMPNHQPIWTLCGVARLATDEMKVEIEVVAHVN